MSEVVYGAHVSMGFCGACGGDRGLWPPVSEDAGRAAVAGVCAACWTKHRELRAAGATLRLTAPQAYAYVDHMDAETGALLVGSIMVKLIASFGIDEAKELLTGLFTHAVDAVTDENAVGVQVIVEPSSSSDA